MNAFSFWLASFAGLVAAFVMLPQQRGVICLLAIPYIAVLLWGVFDLRSSFFVRAFTRNKYEQNKIALTFDDGPDKNLTGDILDLLGRFGFRATFFVVAERAKADPDIVKRCVSLGHTIACHDLSHGLSSNFRFSSSMVADIGVSQRIIHKIIGAKPLLYRPPVGLANPHLRTALAVLSMKCIGWSRTSRDAGNRRLKNIKKISSLAVRGGDVVLLHDCLPKPEYKGVLLRQLEGLFERIKKAGFETVGVNELFEIDAYKI